MDMNDLIEKLLEDDEYRALLERITSSTPLEKEDALCILLSLSYMNDGREKEAITLLKPLHEKYGSTPEVSYWYSSALLPVAESVEEIVMAKGLMLDALSSSLKGKMREDALLKLAYVEEKLDELTR